MRDSGDLGWRGLLGSEGRVGRKTTAGEDKHSVWVLLPCAYDTIEECDVGGSAVAAAAAAAVAVALDSPPRIIKYKLQALCDFSF